MKEPVWVSREVVLAAHDEMLAEHGGRSGIRDEGLLHSALERPQNLFLYEKPTIFDLASAYAFGISKNHPFIDGNKRIGHAAMEVLLLLNGYELRSSVDEQERLMLDVASGVIDRDGLARWLNQHVAKIS